MLLLPNIGLLEYNFWFQGIAPCAILILRERVIFDFTNDQDVGIC